MKKSYFFYFEKFSSSNKTQKFENDMLPGKQIIQNLINYSKALDIINLQSIGKIGILAN